MEDYLVCPICGKHVKNLISHIRRSHNNNIKNREDFEKKFPHLKGIKLQITKFDLSKDYVCKYCGKIYHRLNDLQNHIKRSHPDHYQKNIRTKCPLMKCPICGKEIGNMKQHIRETHELEWDNFCAQYDWDIKKVKTITEEYRKHLSENKIKYYQSIEGQKRKQKQSDFWRDPKNNPMCNADCLEKSMHNRATRGHYGVRTNDCRGIKVSCYGKTFRSFTEFKFFILCQKYGFNIEYEPKDYCVKWYSSQRDFYTTYIPDFILDGKFLIELKQDKIQVNRSEQTEKYQKVSLVYKAMNIDYQITCPKDFFSKQGISLDYTHTQYITETVLNLASQNQIKIITPYRHSKELINIFQTENLSEIPCITFSKNKYHNKYGEL